MPRRVEPKEQPNRFWLPALLVLVATVGAIVWLGRGTGGEVTVEVAPEPVAEDVVEIQSLIPRGKLAEASWREDGEPMPPPTDQEEEFAAFFRGEANMDPFGDEARHREQAEEHLKETVKDIRGLGVYVAPEPAEEPKPERN